MCLRECIYFLNIFTSEICAPYIQSFFKAMSVFKTIKSQSYLFKVKVSMVAWLHGSKFNAAFCDASRGNYITFGPRLKLSFRIPL